MSDGMNIKPSFYTPANTPGQFDNKTADKPGKQISGPDWQMNTQDKSSIVFGKVPPEDTFPSSNKKDSSGEGEPVIVYKSIDPDNNPPSSGAAAMALPPEKGAEPPVYAVSGMNVESLGHNPGRLFIDSSVPLRFEELAISEIKTGAPDTFQQTGLNSIQSVITYGMYTIDGTRVV